MSAQALHSQDTVTTRYSAQAGMSSVQSMLIVSTVVVGSVGTFSSLGTSFDGAIAGKSHGTSTALPGSGAALGGRSYAGVDSTSSTGDSDLQLVNASGSDARLSGSDARLSGSDARSSGSDARLSGSDARSSGSGASSRAESVTDSSISDPLTSFLSGAQALIDPSEGFSLVPSLAASTNRAATSEVEGEVLGPSKKRTESPDAGVAQSLGKLSDRELAERRGKLYLQMESQLKKFARLYDDEDLDPRSRKLQLIELQDALSALQQRDQQLEEEQSQRDSFGSDVSIVTVLGVYFSEYLNTKDSSSLHDRRFADRARLSRLRRERERLVNDITALKESGASLERYRELQSQLSALDAKIKNVLERDARRFESQLEFGVEVILPKLKLKLKSVGPEVANEEAVRTYLKKPVSVTADDLVAVMPNLPLSKAREYEPLLNEAMEEFEINTPARQAAFVAQLAQESIGLTAFEEHASGAAYEWRTILGNVHAGDGVRYKGRGPIQLTGRGNYRSAGAALGLDLEGNPTQASEPEVGFRIAAWYWKVRGLNEHADMGDFEAITYRINGGYNGAEERRIYWARAKTVIN